jgi:hypothetical protein
MAGELDSMRRVKLELEAEKETQKKQKSSLRRSAWGCMT